ncbi:MAG: hypothetical protein KDK66_02490 [Deltaproteobacteria bacterium]|nr:hypothetical protein [Deltaproteobacteria bacterium]
MSAIRSIQSKTHTSLASSLRALSSTAKKPSDPSPKPSFQKKSLKQKNLNKLESSKVLNPNKPLPGKESNPAVQALLRLEGASGKSAYQASSPRFEENDLYGPSGKPTKEDIDQDRIGDCYYVATLAAIADEQPEKIEDAIQYNPNSETFTVTLHERYDSNGWWPGGGKTREVTIEVTQAEIEDNLQRRGGSTVDNNNLNNNTIDAPIWPAVMETAYAKLNDKDATDGLDEGYKEIVGGWAKDAMLAVLGDKGEVFRVNSSEDKDLEKAYDHLSQAIKNDQPITLSTDPESVFWNFLGAQDGLVDDHVYSLEGIDHDSNGEVVLQLRNPWGDNNNKDEGVSHPDPVIEVKLKDLVLAGGLDYFNIGPEPK